MAQCPAGQATKARQQDRLTEHGRQHMCPPRPQGPHHGHIAAPLQRRPHHAHENPDRRHDHHERGDQQQEEFERLHKQIEQLTDFRDWQRRLTLAALVDRRPQPHARKLRRQARERRRLQEDRRHLPLGVRERLRLAIHGRQASRRITGIFRPALLGDRSLRQRLRMPLLQIKPFHVHKHTAIDRSVGAGNNAADIKRIVHRAVVGPVGRRERVAHLQPERAGHCRADDATKEIVVGEILSRGKPVGLAVAPLELVEKCGIRADHAVATVVVAHADRHGRGGAGGESPVLTVRPLGRRQKLLVEVPGNVFDRPADEVDAVQDQLQGAPLCPHDHVVAKAGARLEGLLDEPTGHERGHHKRHSEGQRKGGEATGEGPLPDVAPGDAEERHAEAPARAARLKSSSRTRRGNWPATSGAWVTTSKATSCSAHVFFKRSITCC